MMKYKHNLFVFFATLMLANMAYAKEQPVIQSNSSHFSIAQLEEAGFPNVAQSMIKSNSFHVEENGNKLKFTSSNSSGYCMFTIQSNDGQGAGAIQLQNVQCSAG